MGLMSIRLASSLLLSLQQSRSIIDWSVLAIQIESYSEGLSSAYNMAPMRVRLKGGLSSRTLVFRSWRTLICWTEKSF